MLVCEGVCVLGILRETQHPAITTGGSMMRQQPEPSASVACCTAAE